MMVQNDAASLELLEASDDASVDVAVEVLVALEKDERAKGEASLVLWWW